MARKLCVPIAINNRLERERSSFSTANESPRLSAREVVSGIVSEFVACREISGRLTSHWQVSLRASSQQKLYCFLLPHILCVRDTDILLYVSGTRVWEKKNRFATQSVGQQLMTLVVVVAAIDLF